MLKSIIDINGRTYMNIKSAAERWNLSASTVRKYCREGRIQDCIKLNERIWYINFNSIKPLSEQDVHQILVLSLQLKNDPSLEIEWNTFNFVESAVRIVYQQLFIEGYIREITSEDDRRIPYDVILTQKGMDAATNFKKNESRNYSDIITRWGPVIIGLSQFCLQVYSAV